MDAILRLRVGVPGHGRKMASLLDIPTVSQTGKMKDPGRDKDGPVKKYTAATGTIINYGVCHETRFIEWLRRGHRIINDPKKTAVASDKLASLQVLRDAGVSCIEFTTSQEEARQWVKRGRVYCRTMTRAKKGKGIVISDKPSDIVRAPLFTLEFQKTHEYRVHVAFGDVIDWVQKKRSQKMADRYKTDINEDLRNRCHGYVFAHKNRLGSQKIRDLGLRAANAAGLDYCAVDIMAIWEKRPKKRLVSLVVCELNSAPGMSAPTTLKAYKAAFSKALQG